MLRAARDGGTVADIARELHLSEGTVRNHLSVGDRQDRRPHPRRGGPAGRGQRLAAGVRTLRVLRVFSQCNRAATERDRSLHPAPRKVPPVSR